MRDFSLKLSILLASYLGLHGVIASSQDKDQYEAKLVKPLVIFGKDLLRTAGKEAENIVISPVSIQSALNLVLLGAKSGSKTEKELVEGLGYIYQNETDQIHEAYSKLIEKFKQITEGAAKRRGAKRPAPLVDLWTKIVTKEDSSSLKTEYLDSVTRFYNSSIVAVTRNNLPAATSVAKEINDWSREAGFGSDLISGHDLVQEFSLLLLSAIRLESRWLDQFVAQQVDELFHNYGGLSSVSNGTALIGNNINGRYAMFPPGGSRRHQFYEEFYAVSLPLMGDISFVCIIPQKSGPKALAELEAELLMDDQMLQTLKVLDEPESSIVFKRVQLPKFEFETELNLVEPLKSLGIASVFDQMGAKLDEMGSSTSRFLSDVKHRALIEVNEVGLKAAAVTVIQAETLADDPPSSSLELTIDRPFAFVVRLGRLPLFMGHLVHLV